MTDVIELRGLRMLLFCGVLPEEIGRRQPFEIDCDIHTDTSVAGASDLLADAIDYGAVCDLLAELVDTRFSLMEAVAETATAAILARTTAAAVTVTVRKLRPPVAHHLATAAVRVTRTR